MPSHAPVEFAGHSANGRFIANVRLAQAARGHAADMVAIFEQDHLSAGARRLHCGHHAGRGSAKDAEIIRRGWRRLRTKGDKKDEQ